MSTKVHRGQLLTSDLLLKRLVEAVKQKRISLLSVEQQCKAEAAVDTFRQLTSSSPLNCSFRRGKLFFRLISLLGREDKLDALLILERNNITVDPRFLAGFYSAARLYCHQIRSDPGTSAWKARFYWVTRNRACRNLKNYYITHHDKQGI